MVKKHRIKKITHNGSRWLTKHEIIEKMWRDDCHCSWCGKETLYFLSYTPFLPDFAATIDHLYPKSHSKRKWYKRKLKPSPFVLSCFECNQERGNMDYIHFEEKMGVKIDWENRVYN